MGHDKAVEMLRGNDKMKPREMKENLRHENGVQVETKRAAKALCAARKRNEIEDASFDLLPDTFRRLVEQNPGTVSEVVLERGRFSMAFICP